MKPTGQEIISRFDAMKSNRGTWETMWQEISDNVLGRRNFTSSVTPGSKKMPNVFDTTAVISLNLLSAALHSLLTNSETKWFELRTEDPGYMEVPEAKQWLEVVSDRMLNLFARPQANFTPQIHEAYFDLIGFGTGCFFVEDRGPQGPLFSARPLAEIFLAESAEGRVDTVYRRFELTNRQAVQMFGEKKVEKAFKSAKTGKPDATREYMHCVMPNEERVYGNVDYTGMPWASYYVDMDEKEIIDEGGYHEMPYMTPRWEKDAGEIYGRGPGVTALADAKMLNEISKTTLKGAQKKVDPPMFVPHDGIVSNMRMVPGGVNVVDSSFFGQTRGNPVSFAQSTADVGLGVEMEERRARNVKRAFHHELLQLFEDPRMTATQVIELSRTAQRLLSPTLGRQQVELLEPLVERVFGIGMRNFMFPPPPPEMQGAEIKIDYVSPVARAQKAGESQAVIETFSVAHQLAPADPSILDNLDSDQAIRFIAESKGIPARMLRDPRAVAAQREARAEAQQAQDQLDQAAQMGEMAKNLGPAMQAAGQGEQ